MTLTVIAENSINWNDLTEAKRLIEREAAIKDNTGVNVLSKHQLYSSAQILNKEHYQYCMDRVLNEKKATELFQFGADIGQTVFFTCMYPEAVDICERIGVEYYKVRYHDNQNRELYQKIKKTGKFTFVSISEPNTLWKNFMDYKPGGLLYCVPKYPATQKDYFIHVDHTFNNRYDGTSDHTSDLEMLKKGIAGGVEYWEKHVRIGSGYLEDNWSVDLRDLEEVLTEVPFE